MKLPPDEVVRIRKMVPTIRELRIIDLMRDYRAIRKNHFGNRVPPVEQVMFGFTSRKVLFDIHSTDCVGYNVEAKTYHVAMGAIIIAEDSGTSETHTTLLHEMTHFSVDGKWGRPMGHGKYFKKEARRIMAAGAMDRWF